MNLRAEKLTAVLSQKEGAHRIRDFGFRFAFIFCVGVLCSSCATIVQPVGEWGRPPDLLLHSSSLKETSVAVRCGRLDRENRIQERSSRICTVLEDAIEDLGAEIIEDGNGLTPDLIVWYLDTKLADSNTSWASSLGFWVTGGIIPVVTTRSTEAELRIVNSSGVVVDQQRMRAEVVDSFGWLTLVRFLTRKESPRQRQRELEARFLRHVQNHVYSQSPKKVL